MKLTRSKPMLSGALVLIAAIAATTPDSSATAQTSFDPFGRSPYVDYVLPQQPSNPALPNSALRSEPYLIRQRSTFNQYDALRLLNDEFSRDPFGENDPARRYNSGTSRYSSTIRSRSSAAAQTSREFYRKQRDADEIYLKALREPDRKKRDALMKDYQKIRTEIDKAVSDAGRGKKNTSALNLIDEKDLPKLPTPRESSSTGRGPTTKSKTPAKSQYAVPSTTARKAQTPLAFPPAAASRTAATAARKPASSPNSTSTTKAQAKKAEAKPKPDPELKLDDVKPKPDAEPKTPSEILEESRRRSRTGES